jgi:hypothetical protein
LSASTFGEVRILEANRKLTLDPLPGYDDEDCPKNVRVLKAKVVCPQSAVPCGHTDGGAPTGGGRAAVALID